MLWEVAAITMSPMGSCLTFPRQEMCWQQLKRMLVFLGRTQMLGITFSRNCCKDSF